MPRVIKSIKDDPRYFNPSPKVQSDAADRMLVAAVVLSAMVAVAGFVFAVAHFFG